MQDAIHPQTSADKRFLEIVLNGPSQTQDQKFFTTFTSQFRPNDQDQRQVNGITSTEMFSSQHAIAPGYPMRGKRKADIGQSKSGPDFKTRKLERYASRATNAEALNPTGPTHTEGPPNMTACYGCLLSALRGVSLGICQSIVPNDPIREKKNVPCLRCHQSPRIHILISHCKGILIAGVTLCAAL
ncbi:hypothetical protein CGCFRS4_v016007 [Colletotrichum fructicola]|nr:hypothetical protein CGCFRS4_v016007 [Colletotrichum fructicola]